MKKRLKSYLMWGIAGGILYFFLAYHIIFLGGGRVELLKKVEYNLEYTFFSVELKKPEAIMKIAPLRAAGIGDILVDYGRLTESQMLKLEEKYDNEQG